NTRRVQAWKVALKAGNPLYPIQRRLNIQVYLIEIILIHMGDKIEQNRIVSDFKTVGYQGSGRDNSAHGVAGGRQVEVRSGGIDVDVSVVGKRRSTFHRQLAEVSRTGSANPQGATCIREVPTYSADVARTNDHIAVVHQVALHLRATRKTQSTLGTNAHRIGRFRHGDSGAIQAQCARSYFGAAETGEVVSGSPCQHEDGFT